MSRYRFLLHNSDKDIELPRFEDLHLHHIRKCLSLYLWIFLLHLFSSIYETLIRQIYVGISIFTSFNFHIFHSFDSLCFILSNLSRYVSQFTNLSSSLSNLLLNPNWVPNSSYHIAYFKTFYFVLFQICLVSSHSIFFLHCTFSSLFYLFKYIR